MNPLPESTIKRQIMRFLKSLPESDWEVSPPGSVSGKPDITGCLKGRYVAIEVKRPGKIPTPIQSYKLKKLKAARAVAFWTTSLVGAQRALEDNGMI